MLKKILFLIGLSTAIGAAVYYLRALDRTGLIIMAIAVILAYIIILRIAPERNRNGQKTAAKPKSLDWIMLYAAAGLFVFSGKIVFEAQTLDSLISPWQVLPGYFFALLAAQIALLCLQIAWQSRFFILSLSLFCFLLFSLAVAVFPLGFGFDPFVHQAALELIDQDGAVYPKTPYYLGQYALITAVNALPFTSLQIIHYYLVPWLAAFLLPITLYRVLGDWLADKKTANYAILFLLIIPFSIFTITTPQNLAWLFLILTVMIGIRCGSYRDLLLMLVLSLAALATQAIAGLPALFFTGLIALHHSALKRKRVLIGLTSLALALALPLIFFFFNQGGLGLNGGSFLSHLGFLAPANPNSENIILNTAYLFIHNYAWLIILLSAGGVYLAAKNKEHCPALYLCLLSAWSMLASYLILLYLDFAYLIEYEQADFARRFLITAAIFFLPFMVLSLYKFFEQLQQKPAAVRIPVWIFLIGLVLVSGYASYPRFDRYHNSHSYTVGQKDVEAVRSIAADAGGEDYIVLANQQVAAAALSQYGFKKYFKSSADPSEPIFYYPIPTGGTLYRHYLDMVYQYPARATAEAAMDLAGVDRAYFVLNGYWWGFDKILAEARLEADESFAIGNGEIVVFKYAKKRTPDL